MKFEMLSTSGDIFLQKLVVSGFQYPKSVMLKQGEEIMWLSQDDILL